MAVFQRLSKMTKNLQNKTYLSKERSMVQLQIDRTTPVQERFLGVSAVYHGFAGMPDDADRVYTEEQCELEADRIAAMGIKIARTYYKWWAWDRKTGWNWENATMQAFYRWCERMQTRGIDIALNIGWCCPGDITGTSWGGDCPFADGGLSYEAACENFAAYASETVHQLIERRGFTNIKYLMLFTETERFSGDPPEGHTPFSAWETASRAIHQKLIADGRRQLVQLIGPNEVARGWNEPKALAYAAEHADDFLDAYGCHIYARWEAEDAGAVHSGKRSVFFRDPGHKIGQEVMLKPDTEYEASAWVRVYAEDQLHISGHVLMGVFEHPGMELHPRLGTPQWAGIAAFHAGKEPTTRLTKDSVGMFDPAPAGGEWFQVVHRFRSEAGGKAVLGMYYDVKRAKCGYADDFVFTEVGSNENLLKNPSFEEETPDWWGGVSTPVAYDIFYDWYTWGKQMIDIIPKGKGLWYDEANCLHGLAHQVGRFTDPVHGTRYAMSVLGLMNAGVETSFLWTAIDQLWPNNHTFGGSYFEDGIQHLGLMPTFFRSMVPYGSYYAVQLMANYLGSAGTKVYAEVEGGECVHCVLSELPDGNITVLIASMRDEATEFTIDLGAKTEKALYRHVYDPEQVRPDEHAELISADRVIEGGASTVTDTIPARSILLYTTIAK